MSLLEYLDFLDEYWEIFGPPPEKEPIVYKDVKF